MPPRFVTSTTQPAEEQVERQRIDAGAIVKEMLRRVDVRAGVRAHDQLRDVRAAAGGYALDRLQLELGVPGVGGNACGE
jgi:hypothetical protein